MAKRRNAFLASSAVQPRPTPRTPPGQTPCPAANAIWRREAGGQRNDRAPKRCIALLLGLDAGPKTCRGRH